MQNSTGSSLHRTVCHIDAAGTPTVCAETGSAVQQSMSHLPQNPCLQRKKNLPGSLQPCIMAWALEQMAGGPTCGGDFDAAAGTDRGQRK